MMFLPRRLLCTLLLLSTPLLAEDLPLEPKPADSYFQPFAARKAPPAGPLLLKKGDRLAICGDSITEQKMYSRLIEDYLTACVPELEITARQYGWSGETAAGFRKRIENDCLRFQPTVATICYGMNDHRYRPYEDAIAASFLENLTAVVDTFQAAGVRIVLGSSGTVGKMPSWVKEATGTVDDLNVSLGGLRNLGLGLAAERKLAYADLYWPMLTQGFAARKKYGEDYFISGKDGVHPGWAGHLVMAYAFLKAMGLQGEIGTVSLQLGTGKATVSPGHELVSAPGQPAGHLTLVSHRYPFCAKGPPDQDGSLRSGMELVPFNQELNRFILRAEGGAARQYRVTWGPETHTYSTAELAQGINLAADFVENPFTAAFAEVDAAVLAKESFETKEIKKDFRSPEAKADLEAVVTADEEQHAVLARGLAHALLPVTHTVVVEPLP